MSAERSKRRALWAGIPAALVVGACIGTLIEDSLAIRHRTPADERRVAALQEQARTDPGAAIELEAEQKRQTERSLGRDKTIWWVSATLTIAAALFIASAKRLAALAPRPAPRLEELVTQRAPPALGPAVSSPQAPGAPAVPAAGTALEEDLGFVEALVAQEGRSREAAVAILQAIQAHYRYLPDAALERVCELTDITPSQIAGISSFYAQFRRSPVGRHVVKVCHGTACHVAGARQVTEELRRYLEIPPGADTDPRGLFTLDLVACLGCCSLAPVLMIDEQTAGRLTPASACAALQNVEEAVE